MQLSTTQNFVKKSKRHLKLPLKEGINLTILTISSRFSMYISINVD